VTSVKSKALMIGMLALVLLFQAIRTAGGETTPVPTTLQFKDPTGTYTVRLTFPFGQGKSAEEHYKIPNVYGEFVKIGIEGLSESAYYVNVKIEVIGASVTDWRLYMRENMWDAGPQTRIVWKDYSDTKTEFGLEVRSQHTRETGSFYFIDIAKEPEGWLQFVLVRNAEEKADCPNCEEGGMELQDAYKQGFPEADPPFTETRCSYKQFGLENDPDGEGTIDIVTYSDETVARAAFLAEVETSRDRIDAYESSKEVRPKRLADTAFDIFKYELTYYFPDGTYSYERVSTHLLGKRKITVTTQKYKSSVNIENAHEALVKCAFSGLPEGKGNHPPEVTVKWLGYKPGFGGTLGILEFEIRATDEDKDPLAFRYFFLNELKEANYDLITRRVDQDGVTSIHVTMIAPSYSAGYLFVSAYDGRGGKGEGYAHWELPAGTGISTMDLPDVPWLDVVQGKAIVNGKDVRPGEILVLQNGDDIVTPPDDPATNSGGGYLILQYPGVGTVKVGANAHLRYTDAKNLQLLRGTVRIEGRSWEVRKESGRVYRAYGDPPDIKVRYPSSYQDWVETIEDSQEREEYRQRLRTMTTPSGHSMWGGTLFEVVVADDGSSTFYVLEDVVDISDTRGTKTVTLGAGETTTVRPDEVPSEPVRFDPVSIRSWWGPLRDILAEAGGTEVPGVTFESRSKPKGSEVLIPLTLNGIGETIGNIDLALTYDAGVLEATEVLLGGLTNGSVFDYAIAPGSIRVALADGEGFSGDGSVAYVRFNVIGTEGSSSPLAIASAEANKSDYNALTLATHDGVFQVIGSDEQRGDCDGDGKLSAVDALCALQMAVGKKAEDLAMDVTGDGKVTSLDARKILQMAIQSG